MTERTKRPYDVRVTVLGITWATSPEEAIELTESELSDCGFPPSEDHQSVAVESEV